MDKTQENLAKWISPENVNWVNPEAKQGYYQRAKRISDVIQLKTPDRVPIAPNLHFFPAHYAGMTVKEVMYDHHKAVQAIRKVESDFQWDTTFGIGTAYPAPFFDALDYKQLRWPGHGVSDNSVFQFVEGQYMLANEYDAFLDDPSGFLIRTYLPRICGTLEPFKNLPSMIKLLPYHSGLLGFFGASLPGLEDALDSIIRARKALKNFSEISGAYGLEMKQKGYPNLHKGGLAQAPFDTLGDTLRGTQGVMLDMYRQPDKLLKALDKLLPIAIQQGAERAKFFGNPFCFIPLHKGAKGFMSLDQFKTFFWPTLHRLMLGLIDEGVVPMPFFESDYSDRLDIIKNIPAGKAIYWFERTDVFKAKEVLKDTVCIKGNVPSSLLCIGTPEDVKAYCKKLIDIVGRDGGLIVDGDVGIPDEARAENIRAMTEAVREYGIYQL